MVRGKMVMTMCMCPNIVFEFVFFVMTYELGGCSRVFCWPPFLPNG